MSLRICHVSDTHIDDRAMVAGRIVLDAQGRNIRGVDRVRCFQAAMTEAHERGCHLIIHAGDLFEHNRPTPAEYCAASAVLDVDIPTILVADNHGAVESATERHAVEPLAGRRPNLYVSVRPELLVIPTAAGPVQVATLPSPRRSIVASKEEFKGLSPEGVNAVISDRLRAIIRGFRARLALGIPTILMFHGRVQGAWLTDLQQATGSEQIALTPEDFEGFDYVGLGDFHGYQQVAPNAWYSGATDRTSFNEEHQAKGWILATLHQTEDGPAAVTTVEFMETPARRYLTFEPHNLRDEGLLNQALLEYREDLKTCPVMRVKGRIPQEEYDTLQPFLARWREIPIFAEALEITRQTTARSEAMTAGLDEESALRIWAEANGRELELPDLLIEHRRLSEAHR